jgi:glycosyltransferase involved in cell wall biosynthesis
MKILFNCSINTVGGGVKNSAIFIKYALTYNEIDWVFVVSEPVMEILEEWNISSSKIYLFSSSPARDKTARKKLFDLAEENNVDLVFTLAGPAYVNFNRLHILGISNPYVTHVDFQGLSVGNNFFQFIKAFLLLAYQAYYSRKADFWLFQTNESRNGFVKRYLIDKKKTNIISNAIGNEFLDYYAKQKPIICDLKKTINIFCPASGYPHKCLHMIPAIAKELSSINHEKYKFKFILTIQDDSRVWSKIKAESKKLNVEQNITNIGPYNYANVLSVIDSASMIFVPSILETFSASYLEAFASKRPLITSNKGFAKDICKGAAIYVDSLNALHSAVAIDQLIRNKETQKALIEKGENIINEYGNQEDRVNSIIIFLNDIFNKY